MTKVFSSKEQLETALPKKAVLLVEDDFANAETLHLLLQSEGLYETYCFSNVHEILNNLESLLTLNPRLFLLDYHLPYMSGLDLYARLHAIKGLEQVPAILLTATTLRDTEKTLIEQQGLSLVNKPYDTEELLSLIRLMACGEAS